MTPLIHSLQSFVKSLSPTDLTILAGFAATGLQYLVSKYQEFAKIVNYLIAIVFPFVSITAMSLISSPNLIKAYPWVFVASQVTYAVVEWIKRNAKKSVVQTQF